VQKVRQIDTGKKQAFYMISWQSRDKHKETKTWKAMENSRKIASSKQIFNALLLNIV